MATILQTTFSSSVFLHENCCILNQVLLNFVSNGSINTMQTLVQIMTWCEIGDKPLYEPMVE